VTFGPGLAPHLYNRPPVRVVLGVLFGALSRGLFRIGLAATPTSANAFAFFGEVGAPFFKRP
jgi:hypothetical protein